jgi:hypothetical protein
MGMQQQARQYTAPFQNSYGSLACRANAMCVVTLRNKLGATESIPVAGPMYYRKLLDTARADPQVMKIEIEFFRD